MSLFRSELMGYFHIVMPRENAWEIMNEIGELSAVQFDDLNEHEQILTRPYSSHIKRCEEMELKVQLIEQSMARFKKQIQRCSSVKAYLKSLRDFLATRNRAEHTYFEDLEAELEEKLGSLTNQIKYYDSAVDDYNRLVENILLLEKTSMYFGQDAHFQGQNIGSSDEESKQFSDISNRDIKFCYLAGVIDRVDSQRFRRMLFRATLGMVWSVLIDIEPQADNADQPSGENLIAGSKGDENSSLKTIFLIAYPGGAQDVLKNRLNKIADSFGAHKYQIPEDNQSFKKKILELHRAREDASRVLEVTRNHIDMVLETFSQPRLPNESWSMIEGFRLFVLKEKTIYHNLNMLKLQNTIYHGNCWCPIEFESQIREALESIPKRKPHIAKPEFQFAEPPSKTPPPTFFKTNEFTAPFQEIVNTYGIPRYREVNPGLFTIATFPFLFGVMFGDIGHGGLIFLFGLYLCFQKNEIERQKNAFVSFLPMRYLLTMMGFFAFYCGFIYNDFMAVPLNLFGSCFQEQSGSKALVRTAADCVYPFGIDPEWYHKSNELTFFNSFKMKMAVILGISQMVLGTMLKMVNAIHFRSALDFFFEWVPQICFLCSTFGYMVVLIFMKWATPYIVSVPSSQAPAIINIFIKFLLSAGAFDVGQGSNVIKPLYGDDEGKLQSEVQLILLLIAVVCVPLMLFPKPLILACSKKKGSHNGDSDKNAPLLADYSKDEIQYSKSEESKEIEPMSIEVSSKKAESSSHKSHGGSHEHEDEGFGDLFVHQLIETIEFVLGSLSHTASYLRLWALSLAHSQLAKVFFDKTIGSAVISGNFFSAFIGFAIFAQVTFGVLLCMDLMECFLHALRLHWVEFQSKFYKADGVLFEAFSFENSLKAAAKE